jgi:signal transduction histidine kinase
MNGPGVFRLSVKLGLVLFVTVAFALAIVGLAVLPQLESRLVDAKLRELRRSAQVVTVAVLSADRFRLDDVVGLLGANVNARVVVFDRLTATSLRPVADSSSLRSTDVIEDPVALEASRAGAQSDGRVTRGEREYAEVAVASDPVVVLLAAPLDDALANVKLVRKYLVISGSAALAVSWLAGLLAATFLTRRIGRLEAAAERIASGDFTAPVVDTGRDELGQLAGAMESMRQRLAQLDRARRDFIANASHELRTPLFSLGGFLELLDDEDLDDSTRAEFLGEMRGQVARLTRLATDLLDLSRLDAGQLAVEAADVDLTAVARTAVDELRVVAEAAGHELTADGDAPVLAVGDEQRVLQIARNLLENALRHTPRGTAVAIEARVDAGRAVLEVRDTGSGIPAGEQEHVFERFFRGAGASSVGSGLGLAIARELALRMGGSLVFRSFPGETVFLLALPLAAQTEESAAREVAPTVFP